MLQNIDGLIWLLLLLGPFFIIQRSLHREVQLIFLLLTRRMELALALFSLLFLPGVFLHELSHWVMARLLGVPTGRFSLMPQTRPDGHLQLGYLETAKTDWLRDALIGAAPLLFGGVFVAYAGASRLGLAAVWAALVGQGPQAALAAAQAGHASLPDFWLWFYLAFAVSSTMLPSASDRRAWLPLGLVITGLALAALIAGLGPWLAENLGPLLNGALRALAAVFGISLALHLIFLAPAAALRALIQHVTGLKVAG